MLAGSRRNTCSGFSPKTTASTAAASVEYGEWVNPRPWQCFWRALANAVNISR
jgi:hypothetical protein